jgi:hypothetical protein
MVKTQEEKEDKKIIAEEEEMEEDEEEIKLMEDQEKDKDKFDLKSEIVPIIILIFSILIFWFISSRIYR